MAGRMTNGADIAREMRNAAAVEQAARASEIRVEIDRLVAGLWGFSRQELEEIQRSLEELR